MNKSVIVLLSLLAVGNASQAMDQFLSKSNSQQQIIGLQTVGATAFSAGVIAGIKNQMMRAKMLGALGVGAGFMARPLVESADASLQAFTTKEKVYNAFGISTHDQRVTGLVVGATAGATAGAYMSLAKTKVRPTFGMGLLLAFTSAIASAKAMVIK